jgi:membrane protein implicated in regulation of membrane protease activity
MNAYFWVAFIALGVLALSLVLDGLDVISGDLGPDWLSLPVLAAVVAAFGLAAGAAQGAGAPWPVVLLAGVAVGVGAGALTARLIAATMRLPTYPPLRHTDLYGRVGRVVTPIAPDQPGEVLVALGGTSHKLTARSRDALALGADVVVVEVVSPTMVEVADLGLDEGELHS